MVETLLAYGAEVSVKDEASSSPMGPDLWIIPPDATVS
jgi:hypothetical protein